MSGNFALGRDLDVTGMWYQRKDIHKFTWQQNPQPNQLTGDNARMFVM
jgi:uncharacterized metal-binding protein